MSTNDTTTENGYAHTDLTLHGKFTPDGEQYRLYVLLNGVEVPVQYLDVKDYREKFDEAAKAGEQASQQSQSQ